MDTNTNPARESDVNGPRRQFLKSSLVGAGALLAQSFARALPTLELSSGAPGFVPRKPLGVTGEKVSIIGLGGYHLGTIGEQKDIDAIVHEALDAGVNFFDNAWDYNDGRSEEVVGRALEGHRNQVFLMTKVCTHGRDKAVAMDQLHESLRRLKTDHLDLWQIHEVIYENDPELHFRKGGVVEALTEAKQQGKVRFVGFTGHKDPSIHLKMLSYDFAFDTVQMPLNCFDGSFRSFEQRVLPEVLRRNMAALGMKSLGGDGQPVVHGIVTPEEALRYALSLPVATTISGVDSLSVLRQNLAIARDFKPMTEGERNALRQRCAAVAADGRLELYKTTVHYDGKVGREQHGYASPEELPL